MSINVTYIFTGKTSNSQITRGLRRSSHKLLLELKWSVSVWSQYYCGLQLAQMDVSMGDWVTRF